MRPVLVEAAATPLACSQTEHAENTALSDHLRLLERSDRWQHRVLPALSTMLADPPQQLRLAPTARSLLR